MGEWIKIKICHSVCERSKNIISQNEHQRSWWTLWKKRLEEISFDLLFIYFVYHTHNSLENLAENIRVLLNCQYLLFLGFKNDGKCSWSLFENLHSCLCLLVCILYFIFYLICVICVMLNFAFNFRASLKDELSRTLYRPFLRT